MRMTACSVVVPYVWYRARPTPHDNTILNTNFNTREIMRPGSLDYFTFDFVFQFRLEIMKRRKFPLSLSLMSFWIKSRFEDMHAPTQQSNSTLFNSIRQ